MNCSHCGKKYANAHNLAKHVAAKHATVAKQNRTAEGNCRIVPNPSGEGFVQEYVGQQ